MEPVIIEDDLTARIIECIIRVHQALGPGFIESVYKKAMIVALRKQGLTVDTERKFKILYEGELVGQHRIDLLVADKVIVELKTVEDLHKVHYAQIRSYLKATGLRVGILVNFSKDRADYRRIESH